MTVDCLIDGAVAATLVVITAGWMVGVGWGEHNGKWIEVGWGCWGGRCDGAGIEPISDLKGQMVETRRRKATLVVAVESLAVRRSTGGAAVQVQINGENAEFARAGLSLQRLFPHMKVLE